jgi:hypothetical protein
MKRFLVMAAAVLLAPSAYAADLPAKAKTSPFAPASAAAPGPFYIGGFAGVGWSKTENELTFFGEAQGPLKAYPTGVLAGLELGYSNNTGPLYWGANVSIAYDFSRGDVGGVTPGTVLGSRKNGLMLQEAGELGFNLATIGGYIPTAGQPQNWPVPITVPGSVWGNLVIAARGGLAQRDVTFCVTDPTTLEQQCATKFINGPFVGGKVKARISAQTEVFLVVDHIFWNSSFTPQAAIPAFANTIRAKDEDLFKVGFSHYLDF